MRRLLIRPGALGDLIVSLPALESLRSAYTEVWTTRENMPLVRFADAVQAIPSTGLDSLGLPHIEPPEPLVERLRSFDHVVSWYGSHRPEVRDAFDALNIPVTFLRALPPDEKRHAVDHYLGEARALSGHPVLAMPHVSTPWLPRRGVAIHPFSGSSSKNWPLQRFREVAEKLDVQIHWLAGPEEELEGATRHASRYDLAIDLAGVQAFLGNDSGVSHLAAAVGTPTVAIFGPTSPDVWSPRGSRVTVLRAHSGELEDVPVDEVAAAVRALL